MDIANIRRMDIGESSVKLYGYDKEEEDVNFDSSEDLDKYVKLVLSYWEEKGNFLKATFEGREN